MLLILEIWLTVKAWRNGWRGWALLPMGAVMGIAFLIGMAVGAAGGSVKEAYPVVLLIELTGVGALIRMAIRPPRPAQQPVPLAVEAPTVAVADNAHV
jgi:hypothetical protein